MALWSLLQRLFGFRRRVKKLPEVVPPPVPKAPVPKSMVVIDIPNIINREEPKDGRRSMRVRWDFLRMYIAKELSGTECVFKKAYSSIRTSSKIRTDLLIRERSMWLENGYLFKNHGAKDIDAFMRHDIQENVARHLRGAPEASMHIVLVSGDGGYLHVLRGLLTRFRGRVRITVVAWNRSLNRAYYGLGEGHAIQLLDAFQEEFVEEE